MDYVEFFERFWDAKGESLSINNPTRTYNNLHRKMESFHSIAEIDDYVCTMRTRKESTRKIMVAFFDYLKNDELVQIEESVLEDKHFYDFDFERRLEIAKYLHKPRTKEDIIKQFDIAGRTLDDDLEELELGVRVFGSTIQIERLPDEGSEVRYKTTVHPVFLPLNMTEVFALTKYLEAIIDPSDPNGKAIQNISNRIKGQLSDYAWDHLFHGEKRRSIENNFIDDEKMARQRDTVLMYLMKSGQPCTLIWEDEEYRGRIKPKAKGGYEIILEEDGRILPADFKDVDIMMDSFEYK